MVANDDVYPVILPTARSRPSETPVLTHPALQRRSALRDRRPRAVRRHTGRVATRFAVLLTGDLVAIFCAGAYGASASPSAFLGQGPAREMLV